MFGYQVREVDGRRIVHLPEGEYLLTEESWEQVLNSSYNHMNFRENVIFQHANQEHATHVHAELDKLEEAGFSERFAEQEVKLEDKLPPAEVPATPTEAKSGGLFGKPADKLAEEVKKVQEQVDKITPPVITGSIRAEDPKVTPTVEVKPE